MDNIIFGIRPVIEAIETGKQIEKVYLRHGADSELLHRLVRLIKQHGIFVQWVPVERLNRFTQKNHQGVVALCAAVELADFETVAEHIIQNIENPLVIILDGVTDVRNFGAIARSAECAGAQAVIMPAKGAAPVNADAVKTSCGALSIIPVCRVPNLKTAVFYLKSAGFQIIAATEKAEKFYYEVDYVKPTAIIMGAEDTGISRANIELCDEQVKIPICGKINSLNVSAAASVLMFETVRQKQKPTETQSAGGI
ncbi:MAG: 23S rRNA (guanosine(2251)-2'-O)-methyltransferase RlmB [Prevotellaceae bacterium]|jgi:23S rRNA (guanosine2251-2'-O)-methyltransferase|nr:23S rRNA (guanosine(2251)-2'-O)-methyltransferase RlmB [Prevotellaceae bacterium]